jgi:hypothetical protein
LRTFGAQDPLFDGETISEAHDGGDKIVRLHSQGDIRRYQAFSKDFPGHASDIPVVLNEPFPNAFASKGSSFELGIKHYPFTVHHLVDQRLPQIGQQFLVRFPPIHHRRPSGAGSQVNHQLIGTSSALIFGLRSQWRVASEGIGKTCYARDCMSISRESEHDPFA